MHYYYKDFISLPLARYSFFNTIILQNILLKSKYKSNKDFNAAFCLFMLFMCLLFLSLAGYGMSVF